MGLIWVLSVDGLGLVKPRPLVAGPCQNVSETSMGITYARTTVDADPRGVFKPRASVEEAPSAGDGLVQECVGN